MSPECKAEMNQALSKILSLIMEGDLLEDTHDLHRVLDNIYNETKDIQRIVKGGV